MGKNQRLLFVDLHRGLVLLLMIEVHVFNAMLLPQMKTEWWFPYLNFMNGLVAPSFLFISGFAFVLAGKKKLADFRKFKFTFWRQIGRIGLIFLVGYSLHLPFLSLQKMLHEATPSEINSFLNVDVLQCIAFGLLVLFILRLLINKDRLFIWLIFSLGAFSVWIAPYFWNTDAAQSLPTFLSNFLTKRDGSFFPLLPWLGFMFLGAVTSSSFIKAQEMGTTKIFFKNLSLTGLALMFVGHLSMIEGFFLQVKMPAPNYLFFLLRLGYVFLIFSACWFYEISIGLKENYILDVSRESLLVYWLHLQIIFRKVFNDWSLQNVVGQSLSLIEAVAITLIFIIAMMFVARNWHLFKVKFPLYARITTAVVVWGCVIVFLVN
ncbi:MAG: hypothetical protein COZ80_11180 [Ignavibacteria bacterium CG_4_8_14_3_um_filter_37_9]|nr:DUF1624 domain-containing protein [Ignavibacteria bacterium]OIO14698.1 MAG: hypothetical protein AUJ54_13865 [Ignavibacteria bacterium CG1_02_37_35]PIP78148.1 MAG: hypothetical protein COW85_05290 [Ignavibacteria bacterium CG22_combo_CG10-13_8_21_14_all_37_15]PIW98330.1 MAG: hypothetical protein COZ80_11180 [Ignavibacteria bacterium CG_4_8_14_3_um_filter_37_9]PIX94252.1 MAG: hypothetical protein COZ25_06510 [Ignavibacteria bacterium CG_4_10_14_3_um_filter_37_18]PJC60851.1 MAG: hypothetical 